MGVGRNFSRGGQSWHFAYLFKFVGDATQMDVHKQMSNVTATVAYSVFPVRKFYTEKMFFWWEWIFQDWVSRVLNEWQTLWIIRISTKSDQTTNKLHYLIQIASPCFRVFPMFWKVVSARGWDFTVQMVSSYCAVSHFRGRGGSS